MRQLSGPWWSTEGCSRWRRCLRLTVVGALLAVTLTGCVIRIAYPQIPWLSVWYAEDYVDLDDAQEKQLRETMDRTLVWHRRTQLPRYASFLRSLLANLDEAADPAFVASRNADLIALWDDTLRRIAPELAAVLVTLTDEQVDELGASLADQNEELARDYSGATREERRARQDKAVIKAFRRITGRLSPDQQALVRQRTAGMHDLSAEWLARRAAWQGEFRELLTVRRSDPAFATRFAGLLLDPNQFDSPEYRVRVLENQGTAFRVVADVMGTLTPGQRDHLQSHLDTWASDFEALARGDVPAP